MRRISLYSLIMTVFSLGLLSWATPMVSAQALEASLDAVELNVLGKKYPHLSVEDRLTLLEHQLKMTHPPDATPAYRVSQLLNAQQTTVDPEDKHAAIRLFNRSVDAAAQGQTDQAMADCVEALKLDPYLIPAYNNLANLQEKKRLYDDAVATYQKALSMAPKEPLLHFNLAVILEKVGKIPSAYEEYRQYIQLSNNPDPQIVALLKSYDDKRKTGRVETDYVTLATRESQGERLAWPAWQLPIPVYVHLTSPLQTPFVESVHQGFQSWTDVTGGYLRFREVGHPDQARIFITLQPGPLMDPSASIGHASFNMLALNSDNPMRELKVSINVNTGEPNTDLPLAHRKEQVNKLVLHELGHAIGIWGHSSDPGDIMYTHPIVSTLSQRDIKTIRKLYGLR